MEYETYRTLERTTIHIVTAQLTDGHCCILMGIHLDKGKTTVGLESGLNHETEVLEERNKVVLGGVWSQIANIASGLPSWGLLNNHVIALDAVSWEMVMTKRSGWSHAHGRHGLLLRD